MRCRLVGLNAERHSFRRRENFATIGKLADLLCIGWQDADNRARRRSPMPRHDSRIAAGTFLLGRAVRHRPPRKRVLRAGRWQRLDWAERIRLAVDCLRRGRDVRSPARAQGEEMTSRDIPALLAILACVIAATVLTWWLSMRTIEYFLPSWG
jgi:hypothetical protein